MSIGKTGHVLVRTSHSRGQPKGQRFQSSKSAMSGGLRLEERCADLIPQRSFSQAALRLLVTRCRVCPTATRALVRGSWVHRWLAAARRGRAFGFHGRGSALFKAAFVLGVILNDITSVLPAYSPFGARPRFAITKSPILTYGL